MAGKKKTETPVVEVSVASTQVTEKPKRTRKKSATINTRDVATVISEITDKKGTVGETTTAVAKILESKEKKVDSNEKGEGFQIKPLNTILKSSLPIMKST